jgi:hypothetical protein
VAKLKIGKWFTVPLIIGMAVVCWTSGCANKSAPVDKSLVFDPDTYTEKVLTLDGKQVPYRAYEGIDYVSNPVDLQYQNMNFYVPSEYFENQTVGTYTLDTAPIFFPNSVGGYMPGVAGSPGPGRDNRPNSIARALARGYIVAAPGARGRTLKDEKGLYTGKAPACIVDLKAAVRYLRYNDSVMPGDAEKIISNGTSAGGALSSLLGATGNSADYESYLQAIGTADTRDDIFAASCYCPITNLENADTAYEWLFNGLNNYNAWGRSGTLTADQVEISDRLKAMFPQYLNSLRLQRPDGTVLTLDANGEGIFRDYVKSFVIASAQKALNSGTDLGKLTWITIKNKSVTDIDLGKFIAYATRMKSAPAFDALDLSSPENNLFGNETIDNQHFTQFGMQTGTDHSIADATVVKMMNPMPYIGSKGTTTARYWRIRHGAVDRDTSLAIPVILATRLQNNGCSVDFALPWGQGHGGDYDLDELFAWIDKVCR